MGKNRKAAQLAGTFVCAGACLLMLGGCNGFTQKHMTIKEPPYIELPSSAPQAMPLVDPVTYMYADVAALDESSTYHPELKPAVQTAVNHGILKPGSNQERFKPDAPMTYGEMRTWVHAYFMAKAALDAPVSGNLIPEEPFLPDGKMTPGTSKTGTSGVPAGKSAMSPTGSMDKTPTTMTGGKTAMPGKGTMETPKPGKPAPKPQAMSRHRAAQPGMMPSTGMDKMEPDAMRADDTAQSGSAHELPESIRWGNHSLKPGDPVSRADLAALYVTLSDQAAHAENMGLAEAERSHPAGVGADGALKEFKDFGMIPEWSRNYVAIAYEDNLFKQVFRVSPQTLTDLSGFQPTRPITRAEAMVFLHQFFKLPLEKPAPPPQPAMMEGGTEGGIMPQGMQPEGGKMPPGGAQPAAKPAPRNSRVMTPP